MSEFASKAIPASIIRVDRSPFALSVLIRFLQGFGFSLVLSASVGEVLSSGLSSTGTFSTVALSLSSFFIGAALGVAVDHWLNSCCGLLTAAYFSVSSMMAGFAIMAWNGGPEFCVVSAVMIGLGFGTDFSAISDLARLSTSNAIRWKAMRCWSIAFAVGIAASLLMTQLNISLSLYFALLVSSASLVSLRLVAIPTRTKVVLPTPPLAETAAAACESHVHEDGMHSAEDATCESDSGESGCCGGAKQVTPTSFRHGVLLNLSGWLALICCLWPALESANATAGTLTTSALSLGLVAGYFLMFTVAPNTGYSVALLPFLLMGLVSNVVPAIVGSESLILLACLFSTGIASGATVCATNAIVGEHFQNVPKNAVRSRLLSVAYCGTAVAVLAIECSQLAFRLSGFLQLLPAGAFVVCALLIRAIPNPMLSNLGSNEPLEHDDELDDVMAAING